jgi:tRNA nucleotidyltransferase (CCA-adding enzyme)
VGGAVRDLLLADGAETLLPPDIDLVVDGFQRSAGTGAVRELADELRSLYPSARVSLHGEFQTAALSWHKDERFASLCVDIATARTEFYPYPAANPQVESSSIRQDLYRRDFTINALAIGLTSPRRGELLDFFGGLPDLRSRQIRVLHASSFIEDPTRIYRAVRFATRLGFTIEPVTEGYIRYAIESGVFDRSRRENLSVPGLATRLRGELTYLLGAGYWKDALSLLGELDALKCIHPALSLDDTLRWRTRYVSRWIDFLRLAPPAIPWLARLEVLLAALDERERLTIAGNLQLPKESIERLARLDTAREEIRERLPALSLKSEVACFLRPYPAGLLTLVAAGSGKEVRARLGRYLARWSRVRSPLDGRDLIALGYRPGPSLGKLLEALLVATLDGEIHDRESAMAFLGRV